MKNDRSRTQQLKGLLRAHHHFTNQEKLILRDHLALLRTRLANERTFMAYVRSAMYLLIGGIALTQVQGYGELRWVGHLALLLAGAFMVVGTWRFLRLKHELNTYYQPLEEWPAQERTDG